MTHREKSAVILERKQKKQVKEKKTTQEKGEKMIFSRKFNCIFSSFKKRMICPKLNYLLCLSLRKGQLLKKNRLFSDEKACIMIGAHIPLKKI